MYLMTCSAFEDPTSNHRKVITESENLCTLLNLARKGSQYSLRTRFFSASKPLPSAKDQMKSEEERAALGIETHFVPIQVVLTLIIQVQSLSMLF